MPTRDQELIVAAFTLAALFSMCFSMQALLSMVNMVGLKSLIKRGGVVSILLLSIVSLKMWIVAGVTLVLVLSLFDAVIPMYLHFVLYSALMSLLVIQSFFIKRLITNWENNKGKPTDTLTHDISTLHDMHS